MLSQQRNQGQGFVRCRQDKRSRICRVKSLFNVRPLWYLLSGSLHGWGIDVGSEVGSGASREAVGIAGGLRQCECGIGGADGR